MAKRVIQDIHIKTSIGTPVKAPSYNIDGERLYLVPDRDKEGEVIGRRSINGLELKELSKSRPKILEETIDDVHPATVRDILRSILRSIPQGAQKPDDSFFIYEMWGQVETEIKEGEELPPIRLSPKSYKWLWSLCDRSVTVKIADEDDSRRMTYLRSLFNLDMAPIAFALCADGDEQRRAQLLRKAQLKDDDDEDEAEEVTALVEDNDEDSEDSEE